MYFSRMYLNSRRRGTRNLVGNPEVAHAMVMSAFPPGDHSSGDGRILWRLDQGRESLALYVVSPTKPSFEHIQEQAGWSASPTWDTRDSVFASRLTRCVRSPTLTQGRSGGVRTSLLRNRRNGWWIGPTRSA